MKDELYFKNLSIPAGKVDAILDTDAYNEIDDQFAIAYMLLSTDRINTKAICAAPFLNRKCDGVADGMIKSYNEVFHILSLMGLEGKIPVYKGSERFLSDEKAPVVSEAAEYIAAEAKKYSSEKPLYIVALGAITNIASAILLEPEAMRENTVIVWLGGHAINWPDTKEFNMKQDVAAARVLFNSRAPLIQLPCLGVVSAFTTTEFELRHWLEGTNPLGDYLAKNTIREAESYAAGKPWSRAIWDVTAVAWLLNDSERFMSSYLTAAPLPQYDHHYSFDPRRHQMRYVYHIKRDALFEDLFNKIRSFK